jgi:ribosomal protein S18 acetylase RimI-like enzyme
VIIRLAAVSSVRDARRFAEIDNLVVRDGARRSGVARSLVTASSAWAQSRDVRSLEVVVWSFNVAAVAFYREIGFAPATERLVMNLPTSQS